MPGMLATHHRDDGELVVAIRAGDADALRELHERHGSWMSERLARRCNDPGVVEEAVQDTFVAVWRRPDLYCGRGAVGAWLWGIARRRLIDCLRRLPRVTETLPPDDILGASHCCTDGALFDPIEHAEVAAVLSQLPWGERSVAWATVVRGLTNRETAALLGIPEGTVKTRMMRVRARLRPVVDPSWAA
jgi:RNA polymerase sigma-70 factor (ECF subfamily)